MSQNEKGGEKDRGEGFLARWSQRKQEAKLPTVGDAAAKADEEAEALPAPDAERLAEEEFDLSSLPKLEDVTETTDITGFLPRHPTKRRLPARSIAMPLASSHEAGYSATRAWERMSTLKTELRSRLATKRLPSPSAAEASSFLLGIFRRATIRPLAASRKVASALSPRMTAISFVAGS